METSGPPVVWTREQIAEEGEGGAILIIIHTKIRKNDFKHYNNYFEITSDDSNLYDVGSCIFFRASYTEPPILTEQKHCHSTWIRCQ